VESPVPVQDSLGASNRSKPPFGCMFATMLASQSRGMMFALKPPSTGQECSTALWPLRNLEWGGVLTSSWVVHNNASFQHVDCLLWLGIQVFVILTTYLTSEQSRPPIYIRYIPSKEFNSAQHWAVRGASTSCDYYSFAI
jgi:hypothetical protein